MKLQLSLRGAGCCAGSETKPQNQQQHLSKTEPLNNNNKGGGEDDSTFGRDKNSTSGVQINKRTKPAEYNDRSDNDQENENNNNNQSKSREDYNRTPHPLIQNFFPSFEKTLSEKEFKEFAPYYQPAVSFLKQLLNKIHASRRVSDPISDEENKLVQHFCESAHSSLVYEFVNLKSNFRRTVNRLVEMTKQQVLASSSSSNHQHQKQKQRQQVLVLTFSLSSQETKRFEEAQKKLASRSQAKVSLLKERGYDKFSRQVEDEFEDIDEALESATAEKVLGAAGEFLSQLPFVGSFVKPLALVAKGIYGQVKALKQENQEALSLLRQTYRASQALRQLDDIAELLEPEQEDGEHNESGNKSEEEEDEDDEDENNNNTSKEKKASVLNYQELEELSERVAAVERILCRCFTQAIPKDGDHLESWLEKAKLFISAGKETKIFHVLSERLEKEMKDLHDLVNRLSTRANTARLKRIEKLLLQQQQKAATGGGATTEKQKRILLSFTKLALQKHYRAQTLISTGGRNSSSCYSLNEVFVDVVATSSSSSSSSNNKHHRHHHHNHNQHNNNATPENILAHAKFSSNSNSNNNSSSRVILLSSQSGNGKSCWLKWMAANQMRLLPPRSQNDDDDENNYRHRQHHNHSHYHHHNHHHQKDNKKSSPRSGGLSSGMSSKSGSMQQQEQQEQEGNQKKQRKEEEEEPFLVFLLDISSPQARSFFSRQTPTSVASLLSLALESLHFPNKVLPDAKKVLIDLIVEQKVPCVWLVDSYEKVAASQEIGISSNDASATGDVNSQLNSFFISFATPFERARAALVSPGLVRECDLVVSAVRNEYLPRFTRRRNNNNHNHNHRHNNNNSSASSSAVVFSLSPWNVMQMKTFAKKFFISQLSNELIKQFQKSGTPSLCSASSSSLDRRDEAAAWKADYVISQILKGGGDQQQQQQNNNFASARFVSLLCQISLEYKGGSQQQNQNNNNNNNNNTQEDNTNNIESTTIDLSSLLHDYLALAYDSCNLGTVKSSDIVKAGAWALVKIQTGQPLLFTDDEFEPSDIGWQQRFLSAKLISKVVVGTSMRAVLFPDGSDFGEALAILALRHDPAKVSLLRWSLRSQPIWRAVFTHVLTKAQMAFFFSGGEQAPPFLSAVGAVKILVEKFVSAFESSRAIIKKQIEEEVDRHNVLVRTGKLQKQQDQQHPRNYIFIPPAAMGVLDANVLFQELYLEPTSILWSELRNLLSVDSVADLLVDATKIPVSSSKSKKHQKHYQQQQPHQQLQVYQGGGGSGEHHKLVLFDFFFKQLCQELKDKAGTQNKNDTDLTFVTPLLLLIHSSGRLKSVPLLSSISKYISSLEIPGRSTSALSLREWKPFSTSTTAPSNLFNQALISYYAATSEKSRSGTQQSLIDFNFQTFLTSEAVGAKLSFLDSVRYSDSSRKALDHSIAQEPRQSLRAKFVRALELAVHKGSAALCSALLDNASEINCPNVPAPLYARAIAICGREATNNMISSSSLNSTSNSSSSSSSSSQQVFLSSQALQASEQQQLQNTNSNSSSWNGRVDLSACSITTLEDCCVIGCALRSCGASLRSVNLSSNDIDIVPLAALISEMFAPRIFLADNNNNSEEEKNEKQQEMNKKRNKQHDEDDSSSSSCSSDYDDENSSEDDEEEEEEEEEDDEDQEEEEPQMNRNATTMSQFTDSFASNNNSMFASGGGGDGFSGISPVSSFGSSSFGSSSSPSVFSPYSQPRLKNCFVEYSSSGSDFTSSSSTSTTAVASGGGDVDNNEKRRNRKSKSKKNNNSNRTFVHEFPLPNLEFLDLSDNNFGIGGFWILAVALSRPFLDSFEREQQQQQQQQGGNNNSNNNNNIKAKICAPSTLKLALNSIPIGAKHKLQRREEPTCYSAIRNLIGDAHNAPAKASASSSSSSSSSSPATSTRTSTLTPSSGADDRRFVISELFPIVKNGLASCKKLELSSWHQVSHVSTRRDYISASHYSKAFIHVLRRAVSCQSLHLNNSEIGSVALVDFYQDYPHLLSQLKRLALENCALGSLGAKALFNLITLCLSSSQQSQSQPKTSSWPLKEFNISNNGIFSSSLSAVSSSSSHSKRCGGPGGRARRAAAAALKRRSASGSGPMIGDHNDNDVINSLKQLLLLCSETLYSLSLSYNNFENKSVVSLIKEVAPSCPSLSSLSLSSLQLSNEMMKEIASSLKPTLVRLKLNNNFAEIRDRSDDNFWSAWIKERSKTLEILDFSMNFVIVLFQNQWPKLLTSTNAKAILFQNPGTSATGDYHHHPEGGGERESGSNNNSNTTHLSSSTNATNSSSPTTAAGGSSSSSSPANLGASSSSVVKEKSATFAGDVATALLGVITPKGTQAGGIHTLDPLPVTCRKCGKNYDSAPEDFKCSCGEVMWIPDANVSMCVCGCGTKFGSLFSGGTHGFFTHKHHCRHDSTHIMCTDCTREAVIWNKTVKICKLCHDAAVAEAAAASKRKKR